MLQLLTGLVRLAGVLLLAYSGVAFLLLYWPATGWLLVLAAWSAVRQRRRGSRPTDLGRARFASTDDLRRAGMLDADRGMILGRLPRQARSGTLYARRGDPLVRLPQAVHACLVGPTGTGKSVSFAVPTLLTTPESCVVLDYKAELVRLTAEHRRKHLGHRCVVLDPYRQFTATPDTYNPLDGIGTDDPLALDDCNDLAAALVVRAPNAREPHWDDSAEACVAAVAATVVAYGGPATRSLVNVREILSHPDAFERAVRLMVESDAWGGTLARLGGQLLHFEGKEKASVLSTTLRHLRFLGTPAVAASVATSTFDPADLRRGRLTVYCVVPPERAAAQAGLVRMWVASLLRACVRGGLQ